MASIEEAVEARAEVLGESRIVLRWLSDIYHDGLKLGLPEEVSTAYTLFVLDRMVGR